MLATGSLVNAASAFRVGVSWLELLAERTPPMMRLALRASVGPDADGAQAAFRDELVALVRDSAEASWRELRRGVDDLDELTRPGADAKQPPHRPQRVKT
jgi:hypothetical protein